MSEAYRRWAWVAVLVVGLVLYVVVLRTMVDTRNPNVGALPMFFVALIEECAKLIVPAVLLLVLWRRRREPSDGLVIGVACGAGTWCSA